MIYYAYWRLIICFIACDVADFVIAPNKRDAKKLSKELLIGYSTG